jgi:hypothetical protein
MKFRAHYLLAAALLVSSPIVSSVAFAEEAAPSCVCPLTFAQPGAVVGSIASISGSVLVSHSASFIDAEKNSPLSAGSRVITGPKSSAGLVMGGGCSVSVGANSSATIIRQGQQLCVSVTGKERTASIKALDSRRAEYGQATQAQRDCYARRGSGSGEICFGFPEGFFLTAAGVSFLAALADDDKGRDQCVSAC